MTSSYRVIDEPNVKSWGERLIINPTFILFAAIIVPLLVTLPFQGRFWIPFVWLTINGVALGSSTLRRELLVMWLGGLLLWICFFGAVIAFQHYEISMELAGPYFRIGLFGGFFFILYFAVGYQQTSYQLFDYLRGERSG